ncbi:MAG: alpha/beta hydrolase [Opitutales bacterium]
MNTEIRNPSDELLDYTYTESTPQPPFSDWLVILGHGLTGDKDRPIIVDASQALSEAGFNTLSFSYAGNGNSEGRFEDATISKEAKDLESVINAVSDSYKNIAYLGHSMGGAVGLLQSSRDTRIKALISIAGMVNTKLFAETEFADVVPDKDVMWEEPDCPLSSSFMDDLCNTHRNFSDNIEKIGVPWLLIHGTEDDVVLPQDSRTVKTIRGDQVDFQELEGVNHVFDSPQHMSDMTTRVVSWLRNIASR